MSDDQPTSPDRRAAVRTLVDRAQNAAWNGYDESNRIAGEVTAQLLRDANAEFRRGWEEGAQWQRARIRDLVARAETNGFHKERLRRLLSDDEEQTLAAWEEYWESLTPEQRAAELAAMDAAGLDEDVW